jgi:heme oxygenase
MPERARKWATFVASLDTILDAETASGHVTAASKAPALAQVADVLQASKYTLFSLFERQVGYE